MTSTAKTIIRHSEIRTDIFAQIVRAYLWLASWAERNVPAGEDGQHIPTNVRQIIKTRNFFV